MSSGVAVYTVAHFDEVPQVPVVSTLTLAQTGAGVKATSPLGLVLHGVIEVAFVCVLHNGAAVAVIHLLCVRHLPYTTVLIIEVIVVPCIITIHHH